MNTIKTVTKKYVGVFMAKSNILTVCISAPPPLCDFIICVKDDCGNTMSEVKCANGNTDISLPDGKFKICVTGPACAAPRMQERWVEFFGEDPNESGCFTLSFIFSDICGFPPPPPPPPSPPPYYPPPIFPPHHPVYPSYPSYPASPIYPAYPVANWEFRFKPPYCANGDRHKCPPPPCKPPCKTKCKPGRHCGITFFR
jgi:hypothetical protein